MFVVCRHAPLGSPLSHALDPEHGSWTLSEVFQALQVDLLAAIAYYTGAAVGAKGSPPKRFPRPWTVDGESSSTTTERYAGDAMSMDDMDAWLTQFEPQEVTDD